MKSDCSVESTREVTLKHYSHRVDKSLDNFEILDWGDHAAQLKRFEILSDKVNFSDKFLLDIGCGLADLKTYLVDKGNAPALYVGADLVLPVLKHAREQQPGTSLVACDIFSASPFRKPFDVIYCSGVFNLRTADNMAYLATALDGISRLINQESTVVLNFLHERTEKKYEHCFYYSPEKIHDLLSLTFSTVDVCQDYLANDFTVFAR